MLNQKRAKYDNHLTNESLAGRPLAADSQLLAQVPFKSDVLDIGCTTGFMGDYLQEFKHCRVWGVEYDPIAAHHAQKNLQGIVIGDLDNLDTLKKIEGSYDVIILAAVLEHLKYPLPVLLKCKELLKPNGFLLISLPNVAHYSIRLRLLLGDFTYARYGILDETHCKLYTKLTAIALLQQAGLRVTHFTVSFPYPGSRWLSRWRPTAALMKIVARLLPTLVGEELILKTQIR